MSLENGVVDGSEIAKNKDGPNERRLLRVIISDPEDVQTVEWMGATGRDSGVAAGDSVLIGTVGSTKFAFAADDRIKPESLAGEERIYSRQGDAKAAEIILRTNGDVEINGDNDFAVSFNKLEIILTQLAADLNAEFTKIAAAVPSYTPATISVDLTPAKVVDVKLKEPV